MEKSQEISIVDVLFPLLVIVFLIALALLYLNQYFQKKLSEQKLLENELKFRQQEMLLQASIAAQENERKRIARDLHDELGATLSISRMHLIKLEQNPVLEDEARLAIINVRSVTEAALSSMRKISHELMPAQLESFGLVKTLQGVVNQLNEAGQIKVDFKIEGISRMHWEIEVSVYRMIMELINNTIKHAGATQVGISIKKDALSLSIDYCDDGKGLPSGFSDFGFGLKSLEARVKAIDGSFQIIHGNGFNSQIILPIK